MLLSRRSVVIRKKSRIDLLKKRVIDTARCVLKSEYLERYIDKFIECEDKGLKPVCLLPKRNMCNDFNTAIMSMKSLTGIPVRAQDKIMCPKKRQQAVKKKLAETDDLLDKPNINAL